MHGGPRPTLPEELLLLCADPVSGRLRRPRNFNRVLGGALLAELLLAGAVTVEGRRITGVRPIATGGPADGLLAALAAAAGKRGRGPRLDPWVRRASVRADRPHLDALEARGLLTARRRRILGILPSTVYTAVGHDGVQARAVHLLHGLAADAPGGPTAAHDLPDLRDLHLAALLGAARLDRRLVRGPGARTVHRHVRELVRATPIADAVRRVLQSDESAAASGSGA
ncbi:GPP34 family phosphoprotein [Streptomyces sp. NPDC001380]|uniref:GPP34 family phosphoprotein n=1 Tax=Streptomyces sp. NPDC001380 TaxID=3364566 RepID=UPI003682CCE2